MLSKVQKVWLWIFGAMFVVPEVLWGNLVKVFKISLLPVYKDVQLFTDKPIIAFLVIIIEIVGLSGVIYLLNKKSLVKNVYIKYTLDLVLAAILAALLLSLFLSYVMTKIRLF